MQLMAFLTLCLFAVCQLFVASYTLTIKDFSCTFPVLSVDHQSNPDGRYFNFDSALVSSILDSAGAPFASQSVYAVFNSRTKEVVDVMLWYQANTGSIGDGAGRKEPIADVSGSDWQVGDELAFVDVIPQYCRYTTSRPCTFEVVSISYPENWGVGKYFEYDLPTVLDILGSTFPEGAAFEVYNARTGIMDRAVWWGRAIGGAWAGTPHARYTEWSRVSSSNWAVGDVLSFNGVDQFCDITTDAPSNDPTKEPTEDPTMDPTVDGCDFDLEKYLEECYCSAGGEGGSAAHAIVNEVMQDNVRDANLIKDTHDVYLWYAVHVWGAVISVLLLVVIALLVKKQSGYKMIEQDL